MTLTARRRLAIVLSWLVSGCGPQPSGRFAEDALAVEIGRDCTVFFRQDAHGTAPSGGPTIALSGTLKGIRGDWIQLEVPTEYRDGTGGPPRTILRDYRIPAPSILYVEFRSRAPD